MAVIKLNKHAFGKVKSQCAVPKIFIFAPKVDVIVTIYNAVVDKGNPTISALFALTKAMVCGCRLQRKNENVFRECQILLL
jgi:hypothetical protein